MSRPPKPSDSAVWPVVESFLDRFRRGERPALTDLVARHPDLAEQLLDIIPAVVELEQFGNPNGSYSGNLLPGASVDHPDSLGEYKILRLIGTGGMGVVYEAEHASLKSRVALKVIHPRFQADEKYLRRFRVEARSAAGLHHTNIVTVFDYGEQDGVFYYAMQYIRGRPLDLVLKDLRRLRAEERPPGAPGPRPPVAKGLLTGQYEPDPSRGFSIDGDQAATLAETEIVDRNPAEASGDGKSRAPESASFGLSSLGGPAEGRFCREVARVGAQVADALEHAHRAGVLHRDVKPSNLLLDETGNIWVTDFGLAKLEGGEDGSKSRDLVGTLRYMAPERIRGISGRAGDLYALGATIYELATLRPAFEDADQLRLIDRIAHEPPRPPRSISPMIPRDLETIILKAMAKEPGDRFGSAREMAEELRKFFDGRPIRSRRINPAERFSRWCRRNPWLAAANVSAIAATTTLAVVSSIAARASREDQSRIAATNRDLATVNRDLAKVNRDLMVSEVKQRERLFDSLASQARASLYSRRLGQRFESLKAIAEAVRIGRELGLPSARFDPLRDEAIACLMLPDIERAGPTVKVAPDVVDCSVDDGFARYALRSRDGTVRVGRLGDDRPLARLDDSRNWPEFRFFGFSPGGRFLISERPETVRVWDLDGGAVVRDLSFPGEHGTFAPSPDGRRIAVPRRGGELEVRDLASGQEAFRSTGLVEPGNLAYRPDGAEIAIICRGGSPTCRILDAGTGLTLRSFPVPKDARRPTWSGDGSTLAIQAEDNPTSRIDFYRSKDGDPLTSILMPFESNVTHLSIHPTSSLLITTGWDNVLRTWDWVVGRERLQSMRLDKAEPGCFGTGGRIALKQGNEIGVWRVAPALEYATLLSTRNGPLNQGRTSIHPGGRLLSVGTNRGVMLRDLAHRTEVGFLPIGNAWNSTFDPKGDLLTNGDAGFLRWPVRVDPATGEVRVGPPRLLSPTGTHLGIDTDRAGKVVAYSRRSTVHLTQGRRTIDVPTGGDCRGFSISPDGRWLVINYHDDKQLSRIYRLPGGNLAATLPSAGGTEAKFSPDGRWLVSGVNQSVLREVGTWREVRRFESSWAALAPDGRLGLFQGRGNLLELIEIATGRILARLEPPDLQTIRWMSFSPDGTRIVGVTNDPPTTLIFDLRKIREGLARLDLDWDAPPFSMADPAGADLPPMPPVRVDYGLLEDQIEFYSTPAKQLIERDNQRIGRDPGDVAAYQRRAQGLLVLKRPAEALADLSRAIALRPDAHLLTIRAQIQLEAFRRIGPAIADVEAAFGFEISRSSTRERLAQVCNNLAWRLLEGRPTTYDLTRALDLSRRAFELSSDRQVILNTRGVVLYRAGQYAEAILILGKNLETGQGETDGYDLFFLAMAHHRLGDRTEARRCFDLAIEWADRQTSLKPEEAQELAACRAEAERTINGPVGELPDDVFQRP